jgi:hypothetical protein
MGDVVMPGGNGIATYEYTNPFGMGDIESDNYFTYLRGDDYFPEVLIGRIAFDNQAELGYYFNKLFTYERRPYMGDTQWYHQAVMVAGSDGGSFVSPRLTKLWCRDLMINHGFGRIDTLFASFSGGVDPLDINVSINAGAAYVNYRGFGYPDQWIPPDYTNSHINQLANSPRFPIMTSIVCATGDYNDPVDICFGETWIRANNKGGSGFIGNSNHDAHTRWTNAIDVGIYWGLFEDEVTTLAQAQFMGKLNLYNAFPYEREAGGQVELYFNSYNILGDPEINCWTDVPQSIIVAFPDTVPFGQNRIDIDVTDSSGSPLPGAAVCLWKDTEVFAVGFTGAGGGIEIPVSPTTEGSIRLTVTARGHIPREDTITYSSAMMAIGYFSHMLDDDDNGQSNGNGDGIANPSENLEIPLTLRNFSGAGAASGVYAILSSESPDVDIVSDSAYFGDFEPGQIVVSDVPYLIHAHAEVSDADTVKLLFSINDVSGRQWEAIIAMPLSAAQFLVNRVTVDGNGQIDPGETIQISVNAVNTGGNAMGGATGILRCGDHHVNITDSLATFGDCAPGDSINNSADPFVVTVSGDVYIGHVINFQIEFTGVGPQVAEAAFSRQVGVVSSDDPIGPDAYGYYCFDNTDVAYADHPTFAWVDISTGWSNVILYDDEVETIDLPFPVQYYGQIFDRVTICDNGYIAMGETWYASFYNTPIPAPQNAEGMIAPYWDDFQQTPLRVYYNYDAANDRFIIGWRNARNNESGMTQTFEIVIYNTTVSPTRTGDNEIIFQYNLLQIPIYCSVGICSPDRRDGIQYLFDNHLSPGAAPFVNQRAIKFTTGANIPCSYIAGDINGNDQANGIDVTFGVSFFKGGNAPPDTCFDCPANGQNLMAAGDVNGNCAFNGIDITYFVAYLKGNQSQLNSCADCPPGMLSSPPRRERNSDLPSLNLPTLKEGNIR